MLKIPIMESFPRVKPNLKVSGFYANSRQNDGPFHLVAKFLISAFYLALAFHEYQVLVIIFLSNMC